MYTPAMTSRLGDGGHAASVYSRSILEWSPSIRRSARGSLARARDLDVAADERVGDALRRRRCGLRSSTTEWSISESTDLAVGADRRERADVAVLDHGAARR